MIEEIRDKIATGQYEFSKHAVDQSILRHITVQEMREAILSGEIIEDYPNDKYGLSCLIFGYTKDYRPLHIQCSYPFRPLIKIITLYQPFLICGLILEQGRFDMTTDSLENSMVEKNVTYTLEIDGKFFIFENVPARVCLETGEQFFAPETVERLQKIIWEQEKPTKFVETPVYVFTPG